MRTSILSLRALAFGTMLVSTGLLSGHSFADDCRISLSESQMDFGKVIPPSSNSTSGPDNLHALGNRVVSLNAHCPKSSKLMLVLRGEQLGTDFKFAQKGQASVVLSSALLDGRSVDLAKVKSAREVPDSYSASTMVTPGDMVIPVSNGLQAAGSVLTLQVEIRPLVPVAELRTRDAKTMEANLSFEVRGS